MPFDDARGQLAPHPVEPARPAPFSNREIVGCESQGRARQRVPVEQQLMDRVLPSASSSASAGRLPVHGAWREQGRISGDLLTSPDLLVRHTARADAGACRGAAAGRRRHVPRRGQAAGYFAAFFLRSAQ